MPYLESKGARFMRRFGTNIKQAIYTKIADLDIKYWKTDEPVPFSGRYGGEEHTGHIGDSWGKLWDCAWFNFTGKVPDSAAGKSLVLKLDISGEILVVDAAGNPVRGLTSAMSSFDKSLGEPEKTEFPLTDCAAGGEDINIWADGGNNDLFGRYIDNGTIKEANISIVNNHAKQLYYDIEVLMELAGQLPDDSAQKARIVFALCRVNDIIGKMTDDEFIRARELLKPELARKNGDYPLSISAIGHAHMDLAWLWPIRETIRKVARTFATVIRNMETYQDYMFGASQAQQFKWLKDMYPALYAQVKEYVLKGRIELHGGAWVESDGNLPSGEAFARQFLYGQQFFKDEFNMISEVAWLPDTFGFTANLPQIFKKSGIKYFVSSRIVSNTNYKSHNTFWWEGQDGSKILTHALPEGTYNSSAAPRALAKAEKMYMDSGVSGNALIAFGIGDGGGGPGEEHIERLMREKDLLGLPPAKQEFASEFFKKLEKDAHEYKSWRGELFFRTFQGTFSSQSRNKYYNRKMELALRELEYACIMAGGDYPRDEINAMWEEVLLYQFHDILPGSSIERVNVEAVDRYREMLGKAIEMTRGAYAKMAAGGADMTAGGVGMTAGDASMTAVNTLSFDRNEWVKYNGQWIRADVKKLSSARVVATADFTTISACLAAGPDLLENDCVRVKFNADGSISSIFDKVNAKETLKAAGNIFDVYEDYGDGWGIMENYKRRAPEHFELIGAESGVDGPIAYRVSKYRYMNSSLTQKIVLAQGSGRIDFMTDIDMQDKQRMVRTSFPIGIIADEAVCEIQYGCVKKPLHTNTLLDADKYEVYAHKWIDFADRNYGVAMLNDGRYGHNILEGRLDLDLARTTSHPGANGDIGGHSFVYSVFPHKGDFTNGVIDEAYKLNIPLMVVDGAFGADIAPIVGIGAGNIVLEAVKKAEDGNGIILRLYEAHGAETVTEIDFKGKKAELANIIEENCGGGAMGNSLHFNPFEVHTIRLT
ncbi:MAG: glycosyl hydrolase-related protein [Oscillospiraceae bacterium]|nr:glycosyl hydrolase-related protein [Oscillospiraceae bacterium]